MPLRKSFRTLVTERLIADLKESMVGQEDAKIGNTVLVVDSFTLMVVNSILSYNEQLKAGFFTVCPFETAKELKSGLRRRQYDSLDALYFIRNSRKNLERVVADFADDSPEVKPELLERLFPCIFSGLNSDIVRERSAYSHPSSHKTLGFSPITPPPPAPHFPSRTLPCTPPPASSCSQGFPSIPMSTIGNKPSITWTQWRQMGGVGRGDSKTCGRNQALHGPRRHPWSFL